MKKSASYPCVLFATFYILFPFFSFADGLYINEFVASNTAGYEDQTGSPEDWIEIFNNTAGAVDLAGYYITDNLSNLTKYRLTLSTGQLVIQPGQFLIIWASGFTVRGNNHVSWGLSASGEAIALVAPNGSTILDSFTFPAQRPNVSMGRSTDGGNSWVYFATPTPLASNNASVSYSGFLTPPVFSAAAGFYESNFNLTITPAQPGSTIIYTTDGSEPDEANTTGSTYQYKNGYPQPPNDLPSNYPFLTDQYQTHVYASAIPITDVSSNPNKFSTRGTSFNINPNWYIPQVNIRKAFTVRAKATAPGQLSSEILTRTYFVGQKSINWYTLPVVVLTTSPRFLYDYQLGIYTAGVDFDNWRVANPTQGTDGHTTANWTRDELEYPAHFELFDPSTANIIKSTALGFRIHGGWTRSNPQKSLKIYFKSAYGSDNLDYAIFPENPEKKFKRLLLRNSGNDNWLSNMRDMTTQHVIRKLKIDNQDAKPAILFLNGEYWGLHNLREAYDKHYLELVYGIKEAELELLEDNALVVEGNNIHFLNMRNFIETQDMSSEVHYQTVKTMMDVENFVDYHLTEIFMGNSDWPHKNIKFFRKATAAYTPSASPGQDGRWRWLLYDVDRSFGYNDSQTVNMLVKASETDPSYPWASTILKRLLLNASFKEYFVTRYEDLLNTVFTTGNLMKSITYYENILSPEIAQFAQRWLGTSTTIWADEVNKMKNYAVSRPTLTREQLRNKFSFTAPKSIIVNVSDPNHGFVGLNTIVLKEGEPGISENPYPWEGQYHSEYHVILRANPKAGFSFSHWEMNSNLNFSTNPILDVTLTAPQTSFKAVFLAGNPLPVELVKFEAKAVEGKIALTWKTVQEKNHDYFEIERSENSANWQKLLTVTTPDSQNKGQNHYSAWDEVPLPGINYYRLKQFDSNGTFSYSVIISAKMGSENRLSLWPNPVKDLLNIRQPFASESGLEYYISDTAGRLLKFETQSRRQANAIRVNDLPAGMYLLHLLSNKGKYVQKFIKE